MSVKERLIEFVKHKGISNSEFCRRIGVSNAFISSMVKSIQPDKLQSIALNFPELNTGWLMTGEGEMLNEMMPPVAKDRFLELASDSFANKLTEMFQSGLICPGNLIAEKDAKINELYREIGRLEAVISDLKSKLNNTDNHVLAR